MKKKIGILMILCSTIFALMGCEDATDYEPQAGTQTEEVAPEEQGEGSDGGGDVANTDEPNDATGADHTDLSDTDDGEAGASGIPEVTDADLAAVPEGVHATPVIELQDHPNLATFFQDEWQLCHLTGGCTMSIMPWGDAYYLAGDVFHFQAPTDRMLSSFMGDRTYECRTNDRNNLLICEDVGEAIDGGEEEIIGMDLGGQMQDMTARLTDATTFETIHTDGQPGTVPDISAASRSDFEELVAGSSSYSLAIRHEERDGELVAIHIEMMIFPW